MNESTPSSEDMMKPTPPEAALYEVTPKSHDSDKVTIKPVPEVNNDSGKSPSTKGAQDILDSLVDKNNTTKTPSPLADRLPPFSPRVVNAGFIVGLILSGLCLLLSSAYLVYFQWNANKAIGTIVERTYNGQQTSVLDNARGQNGNPSGATSSSPSSESSTRIDARQYQLTLLALSVHMYVARIGFLSTGVFVGLAFGFLGFSLFLIGINGDMDASLNASEQMRLQVARISPGVFVLLVSSILIGVCVTRSLPVDLKDGNVQRTQERSDSQGQFPVNPDGGLSTEDPLSKPDPNMPGAGTPQPSVTPTINGTGSGTQKPVRPSEGK